MTIAFFDVDHTLVQGSTAFLCAPVLWREGVLGPVMMARVAWAHLRHFIGGLDYEAVYARGVLPFVGMPLETARAQIRECFEERIKPRVYREGLRFMEQHRAAGHRVVLLSASTVYLLELFREIAPVDDVIAFRQHARDGVLVNDYDRPVCYGPNKLVLARRYAEQHGADLGDCVFYSDSGSDRPLLRAVGHPFAVNPDPVLWAEATRRGWPILRFRQTLGRALP